MSTSQIAVGDASSVGTTAESDHLALLAKLEQANRLLETDTKSLHSISPHSQRRIRPSRTNSVTSVVSSTSVNSNVSSFEDGEDSWTQWGKIVDDWENIAKKKPSSMKEMIRKGIPSRFRGIVWQLLCNSSSSLAVKSKYSEYLKQSSPHEKVIRRDISRTYPEHDMFKEKDGTGQEALFNVIKAYSIYDREVGYCQGSCFVVGLLLMEMPEEEAFASLVHIMYELKLRELFKPNMAELGFSMFQLEFLIQETMPELAAHFHTQNFFVSMVASQWFLTIFAAAVPLHIACHIFDIFLIEGIDVIFKTSLAILTICVDKLLSLDMEGMVLYLQKDLRYMLEANVDLLFTTLAQQKYNSKKMKKLEKEYTQLKMKEQEELVEMRRLRGENRVLQQRIENVEKEMSGLVDRMVQDQMKYARQEEQIHSLKRDLCVSRDHEAEVTRQLLQASKELAEQRQNTKYNGVQQCCAEKDEILAQMTSDMDELRKREREASCTVSELKMRVRQLEAANRELQRDPSVEVERLQEELIACKMREAEANLSLKELTHNVHDLQRHYQRHLDQTGNNNNNKATAGSKEVRSMQEELMTLKIREAQLLGELSDLKQKVMELETKNHISERHLKRMSEDEEKTREMLEEAEKRDRQVKVVVQTLERQVADLEHKRQEEAMMVKIKDAEHAQAVAEMRRRVAELEIANQELLTAEQIQLGHRNQTKNNQMTDSMLDSMQLSVARPLSSLSFEFSGATDSEDSEADNLQALALSKNIVGDLNGSHLLAVPDGNGRGRQLESSESDASDLVSVAKKKIVRKKRRPKVGGGRLNEVEDRTPTQDSFDYAVFTIANGNQ